MKKVKTKLKSAFSKFKTVIRLFKFGRKLAFKEILWISVISSLIGVTSLFVLFSLENLIDAISLSMNDEAIGHRSVVIWLIIMILVILLTRFLRTFGKILTDHFQEKLKEKFQEEMIRKAYRLSLADFDRSDLYDRLVRVNQGMADRLYSTMSFMVRMISDISSILSILIYLGLINWLIPVILLIGSLVSTLLKVKVFRDRYVLERKQTTPSRKLAYLGGLMTTREAARELRLYGLKDYLKKNWNDLNSNLIHERLKLTRNESITDAFGASGNTLTFGLSLMIILLLIMRGALSVGQYAAFLQAVMTFQQNLIGFMYNIVTVQADLRYLDELFVYLDLDNEQREGIPIQKNDGIGKGVQFQHVGFTYPEMNERVIQGLNFKIKPGEKIALVGDNGSGKSTLIKLLLGLYKPTEGKITIDGVDLADVDLNDWWKRATAIFQDFQKFHLLNVRGNIAIGQTEYIDDQARAEQAAVLAGADEMIQKLPEAYETLLGKEFGGQELSQGQWQRIAISRAYFRDADLVILDEPTASLDAKAEYNVYRQFEQIAKDKTVVFISHRLGVAKLADRVIVLKDGQMIEQGTHAELMKDAGYYANMYQTQAQWYQ